MMERVSGGIEGLTFEDALAQLEEIVAKLESGEVPLEESINLYERGAALRERCTEKLKDAKMRIERVVDGGAGTAPLDFGDSDSGGDSAPV